MSPDRIHDGTDARTGARTGGGTHDDTGDLGRLVLAGAGAAGSALALALVRRGAEVAELACRTRVKAAARAALLGGTPLSFDELSDPARPPLDGPVLLLVAVPDRAIPDAAARLAARPWPAHSVALHLSGSVEISALEPLAAAGLAIGGLHPLKSFVDPERDADGFAGSVLALEGSPAALARGQAIADRLDARGLALPPGARPAWHAAATHACNHLVALLDQSLDLLQVAGLDRDAGRAALLPLLAGTLDNLARHAPGAALTGPVVRGDLGAVEAHLQALDQVPGDVGAAYRALATRAVELALRHRDLEPGLARSILQALQDR